MSLIDPFERPPRGRRLAAWLRSPGLRPWLVGLPALAAGLGVATLAVATGMATDESLRLRYLAEARTSLARGDFDRAEVAYERLSRRWPDRPEYRLGLVVALTGGGEGRRSARLLAELAPADRPGYPPAQLWLARRLLGQTPAALRDAEAHLVRHVAARPDSVEGHARLGELYARTNRPALAEPHLRRAAAARPDLLLVLARVLAARGDTAAARTQAEEARRRFLAALETDPDDAPARLNAAQAALQLDDFPAALATLQQGLTFGDDPRYRRAAAAVYLAWADALVRKGSGELGAVIALIDQGLRVDPDNVGLLRRVVALTQTDAAEADRTRAALHDLLTHGRATATVHLVLGLDDSRRGRAEAARLHWEEALRLGPHLPAVAGNLARGLARSGLSSDLAPALGLVGSALARRPGDPALLGTRGLVLLKLGRWDEAAADLKSSLAARDDPEAHQALATAYDHLGSPDLAARHRQAASAPSPSGVARADP